MTAAEAAEHLLGELERGVPAAEIVVLDGPFAGARLVVSRGRATGSLGDPRLDRAALDAAAAALAEMEPWSGTLRAGRPDDPRVYVEPHAPERELIVVGAGHIARPLAAIAGELGFRVTVLDDRPEFATRERFPTAARVLATDFRDPLAAVRIAPDTHLVLVTRGHKYDFEVLVRVLRGDVTPAYVGMVGSRRRVRATFVQLEREGVSAERLALVHAPIGLDIGAETPAEIAVAIAAELVLVRRGGSGAPLRDRERVVARWIEGVD